MSVEQLTEYDDGKVYDDEGRTCFPKGLQDRLDLSEGDKVRYVYKDDGIELVKIDNDS